jgi:hypothetical protein
MLGRRVELFGFVLGCCRRHFIVGLREVLELRLIREEQLHLELRPDIVEVRLVRSGVVAVVCLH